MLVLHAPIPTERIERAYRALKKGMLRVYGSMRAAFEEVATRTEAREEARRKREAIAAAKKEKRRRAREGRNHIDLYMR